MTYGLETVELRKRLKAVREVVELGAKSFVQIDQKGQG